MYVRRRRLSPGQALRDCRGVTAVEFAILTPVMLIFVFGSVQFGWAVHCASSVRWAAESSARQLMFNPDLTADQLKTSIRDRLTEVADTSDLTVNVATEAGAGGGVARVTTLYGHDLSIAFLPTYQLSFTSVTVVPLTPS